MAHAADAWPARPVRFIVPFPPGGPVDTTARAFTQKLGEIWQQPNLVDNRAGAGGMVGAALAAKEPADGYTLFVGSIHHAVNPALQPKMTYDIERDFAPVSFAAMFPVFLVAHPSVPASNVRELIALAKSGNGLSFGSSGNGGGTHLAGELFNMHAGIKLQHIKSGRIKVLGVASRQLSARLPEVPTIAESGLPEYEAYSWAALFAPARTPPALLARINTDFNTALRDASVRQRLLTAGAEADPGTPQQMRERLHSELRKWAQVVKVAGIQAD
jgi:tripartite-type tricarboxylate transporter receptor subunit TctC